MYFHIKREDSDLFCMKIFNKCESQIRVLCINKLTLMNKNVPADSFSSRSNGTREFLFTIYITLKIEKFFCVKTCLSCFCYCSHLFGTY